MFDKIKDMGKLMQQAKEMKSKMQEVQKKLKVTTVEAEAGGVNVKMTGELEVTELTINDTLYGDKAKLNKALIAAFNKAAIKSKELATKQLSAISGDLNLPGM